MATPTSRYHRQYYDQHALDWTRRKPNPFMLEPLFRRWLRLTRPGQSVIDLGCANGLQATMFAGIGHDRRYFGIDISRKLLTIAKRRWPQLHFAYADLMDRSTLPNRRFDAFWA